MELPPRTSNPGTPAVKLTEDQLEELLANDDLEPAVRRNYEGKLSTLRHARDRRERINAMTPQEIVDSIPRGIG